MNNRLENVGTLVKLLVLYVSIWTTASWLMHSNLDGYADMLENVAWGQTFAWGTFKHPPVVGWAAHLWFEIFPNTNASYYALSFINSAIGLTGVYYIAKQFQIKKYGLSAVLLLTMAFPYATLAGKFNANSVLLSIWPWVVWAYLKSNKESSYWYSLWLGVLAALAMLAKYYSGVLLLSIFIASIINHPSRQWYKTPNPYMALGIFLICLVPHMNWLMSHDFVTFEYAAEQGSGSISWINFIKFIFLPVFYWIIPWVVTCIVWQEKSSWKTFARNLLVSWKWNSENSTLSMLVLLPWLITLGFGLTGKIDLSVPWGIPLGYGFSLLWIANLSQKQDIDTLKIEQKVRRVFVAVLILVICIAPLQAYKEARGARNYYVPRQEMAAELLSLWSKKFPEKKLRWVGGQWAENASIAFYGNPEIRILPDLPDRFPASVMGYSSWQENPGVLFCELGANEQSVHMGEACISHYREWVESTGRKSEIIRFKVHRTGWRFTQTIDYEYAAVVYIP